MPILAFLGIKVNLTWL